MAILDHDDIVESLPDAFQARISTWSNDEWTIVSDVFADLATTLRPQDQAFASQLETVESALWTVRKSAG